MKILLAAAALAPLLAHAEVTASAPDAFLTTHRIETDATPAQAWEALGRIGAWWNGQHTYSGDAANLSMELRAGACWCERWAEGSIEHGRVVYAHRDRTLRIAGALGPLQELAVDGILQFAIARPGPRTVVTVTYRVRGAQAGVDKLAAIVDKVVGEQVARLGQTLEKR